MEINMGQSTNAVLAYGYDLGGDEGEWKIQETGEYDEIDADKVTWYDDESDDGFREQAERRLLAEIAGFTETWETRTDDDYFKREREAEARLGIEFESYCSGDYPMYVLATKVITVHRGSSKVLDLPALMAEPAEHGWDDKLRAACEVLGITPKQERPGWVLVSYWG
jgi:hypothetical protein